jgi:hypothetical protein
MLSAYKEAGWNAFSTVAFFPPGSSTVFVGDGEVIRDIVNDRIKFPKPMEPYKTLQFFGLVWALTAAFLKRQLHS